ncbi:MAG TPA: HdeA/HdeB family chaperone [Xanthobacteraceae bacterium]|jgi:acid stress chaperone HdeB|nr:HdeA/HdeB family chaperone [Xanthobacteraceae bacterium]
MKTSSLLLAMSIALFTSAAQAQSSIDITKVTCSQYLFDKIAPSKSIAVWLAGYYNGTRHNTSIDLTRMDQDIDKVEDYCRLHQDATLMDAAKNALGLGQ